MKRLILIIVLLPIIMSSTTDASKSVQFYKGSVTAAKEEAGTTGKLYFLDFVANYCYLCKLMDETTFADESVASYISDNYIPVKVNIDDFDGFAWKQKYNVKVLPTIMVFNSKGELLERYEESMGATRMMNELKKHNIAGNKNKTIIKPSTPATTTKVEVTKPEPEPTKTVTAPPPAAPLFPSQGEGLFQFSVKRQSSQGFGIQIGVFGQYGNVLTEVERLERLFNQPILVNINQLRGKTVYRVIVGTFARRNEAARYQALMTNKGVSGIIKDLSTMK